MNLWERIKDLFSNKASPNDFYSYAVIMKGELDRFLEGGNYRHKIIIFYSQDLVVVRVTELHPGGWDTPIELVSSTSSPEEWARLQLMFVGQRNDPGEKLSLYRGEETYIFKSRQRTEWTRIKAGIDAWDFITDQVNGGAL